MNPRHMIILIAILVLSDLAIGAYGHFTGTNAETFEEYISDPNTLNELVVVFIFAIAIVCILHFGFKI